MNDSSVNHTFISKGKSDCGGNSFVPEAACVRR